MINNSSLKFAFNNCLNFVNIYVKTQILTPFTHYKYKKFIWNKIIVGQWNFDL